MMDISTVKKELLNLISEHRKRIPPDLLARAEMLALHELEQQQKPALKNTPQNIPEKTAPKNDIIIEDHPYDRSAAQDVIAHFLENYNKDPKRVAMIKDILFKQNH